MAPKKGSKNPGKEPSEHSDGWFPCPHCGSTVSNRRTISKHFRTQHTDKFCPVYEDHVSTRNMQNAGVGLQEQREHVRREHERMKAERAGEVVPESSREGLGGDGSYNNKDSDFMPPTMGPSQPQLTARGSNSGSFAPYPYTPPDPNQYSGGFTGRLIEFRQRTSFFTSRQQFGGQADLVGGDDGSQQVYESSLPERNNDSAPAMLPQEAVFSSLPVNREAQDASEIAGDSIYPVDGLEGIYSNYPEDGLEGIYPQTPQSEIRYNTRFDSSSQPAVSRQEHPDSVPIFDGENTLWDMDQGGDARSYHEYPHGYFDLPEPSLPGGGPIGTLSNTVAVEEEDEAVASAYVPVDMPLWERDSNGEMKRLG